MVTNQIVKPAEPKKRARKKSKATLHLVRRRRPMPLRVVRRAPTKWAPEAEKVAYADKLKAERQAQIA